jgi:hypothetical protein
MTKTNMDLSELLAKHGDLVHRFTDLRVFGWPSRRTVFGSTPIRAQARR